MTAEPGLEPPQFDYSDLVGKVIGDRYRVTGVIGHGGMGVVYRAHHVHTERQVAVKMLLSSVMNDAQALKRFRQEAKAASLLTHPNIVSILDFGVENNQQAYLVMDYLDGKSLEDVVEETGPLAPERFCRVFMQACRALGHAHKHGIVHRDIKPSNLVLLDRDEETDVLVIVDFGLVKLISGETSGEQKLTSTNTLVGSPLFMSPEQCRGLSIDHRSDIYSLGCVMYKCLTGSLPLMGDSALDTLYKHVSEPPLSFNQANPQNSVPPALEAVVMKALSKSVEQRQQSMSQLGQEVAEALNLPYSGSASQSGLQVVNSLSLNAGFTNATASGASSGMREVRGEAPLSANAQDSTRISSALPAVKPGGLAGAFQSQVRPHLQTGGVPRETQPGSPASHSEEPGSPRLSQSAVPAIRPPQHGASLRKDRFERPKQRSVVGLMAIGTIAAILGIIIVGSLFLVVLTHHHVATTPLPQPGVYEGPSPGPGKTAAPVVKSPPAVPVVPVQPAAPVKKNQPAKTAKEPEDMRKLLQQEQLEEELADGAFNNENWTSALSHYQQCLSKKTKLLGAKSPALLPLYAKLAICASKIGAVEDSVYFMNHVGELFYQSSNAISSDAQLLWKLSEVSQQQNNWKLCEQLQAKAVAAADPRSLQIVAWLLHLASTYTHNGKYSYAEHAYMSAIESSKHDGVWHHRAIEYFESYLRSRGQLKAAQRWREKLNPPQPQPQSQPPMPQMTPPNGPQPSSWPPSEDGPMGRVFNERRGNGNRFGERLPGGGTRVREIPGRLRNARNGFGNGGGNNRQPDGIRNYNY